MIMNSIVTVFINGKQYEAKKDETLLTVAKRNEIDIPALCYEECLPPFGACRLCIVDVKEGFKKGITASCSLLCVDGLSVVTDTNEIKKHRKILFELYLAQAPGSKKLKEIAAKYGVVDTKFEKSIKKDDLLNNSCILCGLCVRVCNELMGAGVINFIGRGHKTRVNTPYFEKSEICLGCKACESVCPAEAITINDIEKVRSLKCWSGTEVMLNKCVGCGKYYAPVPLNTKVANLLKDLRENGDSTCPECLKKVNAKNATKGVTFNFL